VSDSAPPDTSTPEPTPSPSDEETTTAPQQTVRVTLEGANTEYAGTCPPAREQAPAFTATFTVGTLPAEVSYRWVSRDGEVMDAGWKTLSFPEGEGRTRQDTAFVTTTDDSGSFENEISVEVRDPVRTTSDAVPFSVTCASETPPDGEASPSVSGTP
jgi:hypothetical protein